MGIIPILLGGLSSRAHSAQPAGLAESHAVRVVVDDVTVRYAENVAVDRASVSFRAGELTAIIGPNGSGKSTLLAVIAGLVDPVAGQVRIDGFDPRSSRVHVAFVMQTNVTNQAVPLTVLETIRMGCYARTGVLGRLSADDREAVSTAIDQLQLGELVGRQLHELSGGQRQRVHVAQGLVQRADVLLLDEPITGLDLTTQDIISEVIAAERARGTTVILTTHDIGTARAADQVVLMATRVVAAGPSVEVLTPDLLMAAYGGHIHQLDDGTAVLDDPHHHGAPEQMPG